MDTFSATLSGIVDSLGKSLVSVYARRSYPLTGTVWSDDVIITTSRAVEHTDDIHVGLPNGEIVGAELVGRAPNTDLAALRLSSDALVTPTWTGTDNLKVGQVMLRLGRSETSLRVTVGVLSGLEPWRSRSNVNLGTRIITDADTFRGFSGGVLATLEGELVGVGTAALSRGGDALIPTTSVGRTVKELLEHGHIRQGYLGVSGQPVRLPEGLRRDLEQRTGLLVTSVAPGSPAEQVGLTLGDVILSLNGAKVARADGLLEELSGERIGEPLTLSVMRSGEVRTFTVTVAELTTDQQ